MAEPQRRPHVLRAVINRWGEPAIELVCPYTVADAKVRKCNLGEEPKERCLWHAYDNGCHHPDCPADKSIHNVCSGEGQEHSCWTGREPEECDGFYSSEVGHLHPVEGCWAIELIKEIGWEDAVDWDKERPLPEGAILPLLVDVVRSSEEGATLGAWNGGGAEEPAGEIHVG